MFQKNVFLSIVRVHYGVGGSDFATLHNDSGFVGFDKTPRPVTCEEIPKLCCKLLPPYPNFRYDKVITLL